MHHSQIPSRYKGNISLLVILVLLGSSLIALLAMSQIKNLMRYGATTSNYFKAYYLAKAGVELAITETAIRDAGFQIAMNSWNAIVSENIFLDQKGFDPYFEVVSNARTKEYCKKLAPNESIVIPLFLDKDNNANHKNTLDSPIKIVPFTKEEVKNNIKVDLKWTTDAFLGIFAYSWESLENMVGMISKIGNSMNTTIRNSDTDELKNIFPDSNPEYRRYLTVLNYKENPFTGCVNFSAGFALNTTTINVWAQYGDTEVGLHSDFSEPFPDLLQGLSDISQHN